MIANLIGGFVSIIIGTSLIAPVSVEVNSAALSVNSSGDTCTAVTQDGCSTSALYLSSAWGATVLKLVPGFFALSILGIGIAVTYTSLRQAGIV
ncbi:hypothetical protein LCGC14_0687700 [marine sediment metagenome]|uniref:Uncharacterized protein n=1 Tax=marine sediment metagenome TaxID=412755 RepID=A0A0F9QLA9_9ZZZZ